MREPRNIRFWKGFPRAGDIGVVSQDDDTPIGAAWIRLFSGVELGPVADPGVPVLAIGVEKHEALDSYSCMNSYGAHVYVASRRST